MKNKVHNYLGLWWWYIYTLDKLFIFLILHGLMTPYDEQILVIIGPGNSL